LLRKIALLVALIGVILAPFMVTNEEAVAAASAQIVNPDYASGLYYSD